MALHNAMAATTTNRHRRQHHQQAKPLLEQTTRQPNTTSQLNANGLWRPLSAGCRHLKVKCCQYYHTKKYPMATRLVAKRATAQSGAIMMVLVSSFVFACLLATPNLAHDRLEPAAKRRQPPAIYSYSASELDQAGPALGPVPSHRLNRPYSWANQRLAKLMTNVVDGEQDDGSRNHAAAFQDASDNISPMTMMMGDSGDQSTDLSLLYGQHRTKTAMASPANRWPVGGNRRRRPAMGTKHQATNTKSMRPASKGSRTPLAAAPLPLPPTEIQPQWVAAAPANRTNTSSRRASRPKRKNLVCYYGTWAVYRPDGGKFAVEDIDPFLCTHVIYGFTGLSYDNLIKPLDPWNDLEDNYGKGAMKRFTNLKRINPDLKTLVAIGGWNEGSIKYSKMASDPEARARFVDSVVQFLAKYNFDGLDLDWEYPGSRGGASYDKQNFVKLLKQLHEAFQPRGYLLTAAVSAGKWFIDPAYDIPQVNRYLDLINLMAYDYHGGWETKTGMNAPLFGSRQHDLTREEQMLNVNWSVNYWLEKGASREKIMLGVGSYGRSFTLDKNQVNGINAPASQKGQAGPYTREPGSLGYNELCESFKRSPQSWTIVRDPDYLAPYAYNRERQWVGYDDQESLGLKAQFAKSMGLGGMMMWSIETDDFRGSCHAEKFPLLNTIRRVLDGEGGGTVGPSQPAPKPTARPSTTTTKRPTAPPPLPPKPAGSSTKRPGGHEVEEDQQRPVRPSSTTTTTTTSTRRPQPAATSVRPRPPVSSTSRPVRPPPPTPGRPQPTPTSSTTTTRRPPAQEFTCREAGMFADPQNCRKFIRCVQMGGAQVQKYNFDCAPGTAFNEELQLCDHIYNVPRCNGAASSGPSSYNSIESNQWPSHHQQHGEVEEVSARASSSNASGANNYPTQVLLTNGPGQPLIPLIAVAGHHYPHQYGPYLASQQPPQQPLIVQWR